MPTTTAQPFTGPLRRRFGAALDAEALVPLLAAARLPLGELEHAPTLEALRRRAEEDLGTPWPQPLLSHYARYARDGNRTDYEGRIGERQRRLTRAAVLAAATGEQRWLDETADGVQLLCEQSSWSWAAHDDALPLLGRVVPPIDRPYLDLGAGEVVGQLAWIDALLGEPLGRRAPGLRERMRAEARTRVIRPFLDRRDWHWLGLDGDVHNWNPWIHGNVLLAAVALVDDPEERADVVALVLEGLDRFLDSLPADGAIDEGFAYWWNGAGRALETLELLAEATDGALDASELPVVRQAVRFPHRMHLGGAWYANVADGPARASDTLPWHVLHRWGRRIGDRDVIAHAAAQRRPADPLADPAAGLGRLVRALSDRQWIAAEPGPAPLVSPTWLPSVQLLVTREHPGGAEGLGLVVKGGHNGEHHNHLDVGSVIVALDGVPVLVDAGQPTYTSQTFGPDRYGIRAMQSRWHSTPAPWGLEQGVGRGFGASDVSSGPAGLLLELATAYPLPAGSSLRRRARREGAQVVVEDEWRLPRPATVEVDGVEVHLLIAGDVDLQDGAAVVTPVEGARRLRLEWTGAEATTEEWLLEDPLLEASWGERLTRLTLTVTAEGAEVFEGALRVTASVA